VHWVYDTYSLAKSGTALSTGGRSWYFITADYAFGHALEANAASSSRHWEERFVGAVRTFLPDRRDFSSFLLQAQKFEGTNHRHRKCRPRIHRRAQAGAEFGLRKATKNGRSVMQVTEIHTLGWMPPAAPVRRGVLLGSE